MVEATYYLLTGNALTVLIVLGGLIGLVVGIGLMAIHESEQKRKRQNLLNDLQNRISTMRQTRERTEQELSDLARAYRQHTTDVILERLKRQQGRRS